jgi:mono/diheme cytochrome c family protein
MEDPVTKNYNKLRALRSLGIGFSAAVIALACGSEDANNPTKPITDETDTTTIDPPARPPVEDPCANPLSATCPTNVKPPDTTTTVPGKQPTQEELDKASAENVLAANCGYCHGPALTPAQAQAGMNYIDDIDALVEAGKIVPMNSAGSRVIQRMVRGEMPPPSSPYPPVTAADIDKVASYIDNPRYWGGAPDANCVDNDQLTDFDDLFVDINQDLARADNDDAQFYRYISLTNRFNAGVCLDALDRDRQGLVKMMNMLSIRASRGDVVPANSDETLYRIDLRDFDWDRQITVENQVFNDVWEAVADANPYAVEFFGDDADDAKDETLTAFPVMFADQMMDVAVIGNLYYSIIDVDVTQPLATFISDKLGIDVQADIADEDAIRAGTTKSRISRQDRLVERHDIVVRGGAFWQSFDFADDGAANDSIFEDPFGFAAGGTEAIFTLPNGMLGFIIADENDNIVEDSDILLDTNQNNFRAITSVSCSNCHSTGFIPVVDEVKQVALDNARELDLDRDEIEQLESIYVSPTEFARIVKQDSEGFYQRALQLADLPIQGGDPVSSMFLRFDGDLKLADAAGDLGVTPDDLSDSLRLLNPVLTVLDRETGTIDRDDFTALYLESLCVMTQPNENAPDAAVCDALLDN